MLSKNDEKTQSNLIDTEKSILKILMILPKKELTKQIRTLKTKTNKNRI